MEIKIVLGKVCLKKKTGFVCRFVPHSPNFKMHWAEKARWSKEWREQAYYLTKEKLIVPNRKKPVILEAFIYSTHPQDQDNAMASIKAIIDGIKLGGAMVDDSPSWCEMKIQVFKVNKVEEQHVEVTVSTVD